MSTGMIWFSIMCLDVLPLKKIHTFKKLKELNQFWYPSNARACTWFLLFCSPVGKLMTFLLSNLQLSKKHIFFGGNGVILGQKAPFSAAGKIFSRKSALFDLICVKIVKFSLGYLLIKQWKMTWEGAEFLGVWEWQCPHYPPPLCTPLLKC